MDPIPLHRPSFAGNEHEYIVESLASGQVSGDGPFTRKCHALLEEILGVPKVLLTTSCTHALEMAAILLDIGPGDEVVLPSFTFVSTANAFLLRGAKPVFADIRPDTLNLNERQLEGLLTDRTKAIVLVHYAGVGCEMDAIMDIAGRHGIPVVEDNAHGLFGRYKGKPLGSFGSFGAQSFHSTKNFTCGEGGALIINDPDCIGRAEIIREKGTDRSRFFRGEVDKYTWVDLGSSYLPSDILASILYAQLEAREDIQAKRQRTWEYYFNELQDWAAALGAQLPTVPAHCEQPYHLFYMLLPSLDMRQRLIRHLKDRGVQAVFHFLPLHLSSMGRAFGGQEGDCPVTEDVSDRLLRLPLTNDLTAGERSHVVSSIRAFSP